MSSHLTLSKGILPRMLGGEGNIKDPATGQPPLLQIVNYRPVDKKSDSQPLRFRVVISDGQYKCMGMLGSNLNHWLVDNNDNDFKFSVLRITNYISNNMAGDRTLLVILNADLIERGGTSPATSGPLPAGMTVNQLVDTSTLNIQANSNNKGGGGAAGQALSNSTNSAGMMSGGAYNTKPAAAAAAGGGGMSGGGNVYGGSTSAPNRNNPYGKSPSPRSNPYQKSMGGGGMSSGGAPIVRATNTGNEMYTAIGALNMYQSRWTIKARLTSKSDIRTWSNAKGEGSLFSVELLDASGGDIRATFFKEAVDRFYEMLVVGKVYTFSGGRLKVANMQYNTCSSQYEITFDQNSEIHLVEDDTAGGIPQQHYDFVKIADLENVNVPSSQHDNSGMGGQQQQQQQQQHVDILGVVTSVGEPANLISKKSGRELVKCDVTVTDQSMAAINLTLWGEQARTAPQTLKQNDICAFRRCRLSDFGGRSLSGPQTMTVLSQQAGGTDDSSVPGAAELRQWWQQNGGNAGSNMKQLSGSGGGGGNQRMVPLQDRKDIAAIQREGLGLNTDKADYISFKAAISFLKKDKEGGAWYPACANSGEPCRNRFKVTQGANDNSWYCDKCQGSFAQPVRRWIFSGVLEDTSSSTWVSFFNEQAEQLLEGKTADDVYNTSFGALESGAPNASMDPYESLFYRANHTEWIFNCRVKNETYQDGSGEQSSRVKTSVTGIHPVDYRKESVDLLRAIEQF